ncbi:PEP-CTERM protein-sorting domain-containing protein [Geoalkalibacter ferrihydriticus]|uniref:Ice-binding protein C-terminal domain-containing protein n=2 Tax=Geoalkalibacter ferrihydriticus TaxID=392333 RepID=A0A0C2DQZ1_9BACT|nr:flocculation-associated PEP-CTERM protein PepA [Geoalkalibacter ferrihydriticus]KIH75854.1 hypothetical protein GFER_14835 [Geoalkalibacter ferrihydriticus DSM 17813]SDM68209.1 PEP-CTERM protein-sorting domain-containing protein [Geoalkalibacter ferrihydriticus]
MKKITVILAALMVLGTGTAFAQPFWTGAVNDGFDNWVQNVQVFDWASSGSGLAIGLADPANIQVGTEFTFLYQARLSGLANPAGQDVNFPGLNDTFEYTFVAQITERISNVIDLGADGLQAIFRTTGAGSWYMFHDFDTNSNTAAGTGFQDGTQVATGTWLPDQISSFLATVPGEQGQGSFIIEGLRGVGTEINPDFFYPTLLGEEQFIFDIRLEGTTNVPALDSATTTFFGGDGPYEAYTVMTTDLLFKVDASSRFSVIPEPSTVILLGLGLLGLAGYSRKKLRK